MLDLGTGDLTNPARLLDRVRRFTEELARARRTHDVCSALVCAALDAVAAEGALLYLSRARDGSLRLTAASGEIMSSAPATLSEQSSEPAVVAYRTCLARWWGEGAGVAERAHIPLVVGDLCYGVLTLAFDLDDPALAAPERTFLEALAGLGAMGLERVRALEADRCAIRSQRELLGVVAHELRHPLSVILMRAALLRQNGGAGPEGFERDLALLVRNAGRLNRMIQDALEYAQLAQQRVRLHPRVVDARELLTQVADDAPEPARVVLAEAPSSVDVWCDPGRTAQALDNLIRNALKFSAPPSAVRVSMEVRPEEVVVRVRDRGRGIRANELPHLFEPPHEGSPRRARGRQAGEGAGLGLFISRCLIEAQGGRIWAESTEGEGSQFSISLPRAEAVDRAPNAGAVLVAEGDASLRREIVDVLSRAGFAAVGVEHGAAALEYLQTHPPPPFVLSDLRMPVMSGWELGDRMRADARLRGIPVVALCGDARSSPSEGRFAAHLSKPVTVSELVATAGRFCGGGDAAR